jgi:Xaa-Pro aminopeptidase
MPPPRRARPHYGFGMPECLLLRAASESNADMLAAAGFLSSDPFDYVEIEGRRVLFVAGFERDLAERQSGGAEVVPIEELGLRELLASGLPVHELINRLTLNAVRRAGADAVVVPTWFPVGAADFLRAEGLPVRVEANLLTDRRRRKTPEQVDLMREPQAVTERSFALIARMLSEAEVASDGTLVLEGRPLTSERVHDAIRLQWAQEGCEGETPIVAGGPQAAEPHEHGHGPLRAGQSIICDLFPRSARNRYHADMTRTFCVGEPPALLVELREIVELALRQSIEAIGPGAVGQELDRRVSDLFFAHGYHTLLHPAEVHGLKDRPGYIHGLGHGLGLSVHEQPSLGQAGRDPLEPGDVVTVEPGLYLPGFGGVRLEDVVVVTEDGCENLTQFPYALAPGASA